MAVEIMSQSSYSCAELGLDNEALAWAHEDVELAKSLENHLDP